MNNKQIYAQKLRDPRWQKMRLKVMERDGFCCSKCLSDKYTLNVHHKKYLNDREPWDYPIHYLTTLCEGCHKLEHTNEITEALSVLKERGFVDSAILKALNPIFVDFARDFHPDILRHIRMDELLSRHHAYLDSMNPNKKPVPIPDLSNFKRNG